MVDRGMPAASGHLDGRPADQLPGALRRLAERLPRPVRFLGVGGLGLVTDLCLFSVLISDGNDPLTMRLIPLATATLVTWRLNRALTFDRSGRHQIEEAARYAFVTAVAQGTSYAVFAALILTVLTWLPQGALLAGAAAGAVISYNGHRLFAFAPRAIGGGAVRPPLDPGRFVRS
jgi:putative flippase GtrA